MKNLSLLFVAILMSLATVAQVPASPKGGPQGINYQTVIRDGDGNILPDTELSLQMTIRTGAPDGAVVYAETHDATTNAFGLVNLVIGYGVPVSNAFADINWGNGDKYLETAIDLSGGGSYTIMGVTQFLSVPYALHSGTTEAYEETDPEFNAWDKSTGIVITENQVTDLQDYLTAESDPEFNAWDKSTGIAITQNQITDLQDYLIEESDPEFNAWDKSTGIVITENQITDLQDYLTAETDPEFNAWDKTTGIAITENQITDLQGYLTAESDPEFNAWDKSTGIAITENQVTDLQDYLTAETDPEFNAWDKSTGIAITENQVTDLQDYLTEELDGDPVNELQVVEEQDYEVTLSQGGGSFMTGVKSYTQAAIDAMTPYNGLVVFNTSTNCINYYNLNNWFEACGICTPQPTQAAAGDDQAFYDETTEVTLAANTPEQGTGLWTVTSGEGGSFADATLPGTNFTGLPCTAYTLAWTISNSCGESTDPVAITFFTTPTIAFAGNDTIVLGSELSVNLNANMPEMGAGLWTVLIGDSGTLADATNPTSLFSGLPYVEYTLQWEIATACDTTTDEVNLTFNPWQCGMPFTDGRDGQSYETVQIDEQCWMAENLNIGIMINGSSNQTDNSEIEKYCYNNSEANCDIYGGMYLWNEMMQYQTIEGVQGICPGGWNLPTDAEWSALTIFLGGESAAGGKLKESGTTHWNPPNTGATNSSGFTGLPGGYRNAGGPFTNLGDNGFFWSSTENTPTSTWYRILYNGSGNTTRNDGNKAWGFSVRCVRGL